MNFRRLFEVFRRPSYLALTSFVAVVVFSFAVWLPNIGLIYTVALSDSATFGDTLGVAFSLFGSIGTNFTVISATYTILIALLFGVNIALLVYYIRRVRGGVRSLSGTGAVGIGGLISGFFGIGCAACGTFILTSALALFGATGVLAFLPFGGEEFGFLGVGLLLYSVYALMKKIDAPLVCKIT